MRRSSRLLVRQIASQTTHQNNIPAAITSKKRKNNEETSRSKAKLAKKESKKQSSVNHHHHHASDDLKTSPQTKKTKTSNKKEKKVKDNSSLHENNHPLRYQKWLGGHMSISGGLYNAAIDAHQTGAGAFGLFLRNQRQWDSKPLLDEAANQFQQVCKEMKFTPWQILPHGSYLMNCGSPNPDTLQKSRNALIDELKRCEKLGLMLYNFHPGSSRGEISRTECIQLIAESINIAHRATNKVITVIENMSNQKNVIGGSFEELAEIINRVDDKSRVGVCLDTCHTFAAGYDIASKKGYKKTMDEFDSVVGFQYLRAMHINDSKGELGCHLDRHENIGKGKIGLKAFKLIMNDSRLNNIPMILETPSRFEMNYNDEIKLLYSLCD
ncbi:putative endonuclease 4 [Trichoplax sp. H2]|uniref:Xylose isomerase-like TIM barrel domain-containing protein n=1 Tax=Trichoplax adhaerens TaxID=10228 RepID=B3RPR2_TRIAD|nr:hypothetical protein TRIADDRAFT_21078 [Trichoplax adhaerens]EDV27685.1 hypothetical protein TRIADDRAFT_21078 [Trichoplax adhaerens]RDD45270.1 putative endonuclease 4 [Trichoplax sp. H2]|eukprot:XP_002109519.1 hypothetical protein TRIADDRAFT_21078 [Trichoplax adhaerens]